MADAERDQNFVPTLLGVSNADGKTPVRVYADPTTHRLLVDSAGGGTGTVTEVDTGTGLTGGPITTSGTISLDTKLAPLDTLGSAGQLIRVNAGATALEYFTSSAGGVSSVVGTTDRISVDSTDPANPIVDIAATYVGQTSITTLGTITTGTWAATALAADHGGTGQTTYTKGDLLASPGSNSLNKLGVGTDGQVLTADAASTNGVKWATGGAAASITVGTTTIGSGTNTRVLFDNSGVLGEYTISGSGNVAMTTSPSFTTPTLGVATATSINKMAITAPATSSTLAVADGKTATISNTLTFTGTDGSSVAFGTGGTVLYTTSTLPLTVGTTTIASGTTTRVLYDNAGVLGEYTITGSGTVVAMATAPTFITSIATPEVLATANDSGALGASGTAFSDLFLASGGVINWSAGDYILTHSSGVLTANKDLRITTVGTNAASVITQAGTQTLTNKRITARTATTNAPGATPTTNSDNVDLQIFTGLGTAITSMSTNLSGTPTNRQFLEFWLTDDGTARAITWGASFAATTVALPTTTVISTKLRVLFEWGGSTWDCVAVV